MANPLPIDLKELHRLRYTQGVLGAKRFLRIKAVRAEVQKPDPDFAAIILTLLELI